MGCGDRSGMSCWAWLAMQASMPAAINNRIRIKRKDSPSIREVRRHGESCVTMTGQPAPAMIGRIGSASRQASRRFGSSASVIG
jgi:hypothetical protein